MGHSVRMFVGPKAALRRYKDLVPTLKAFALVPAAGLDALPISQAEHGQLQARYGTGEWLELPNMHDDATPLMLTSTDITFAVRASQGTALAYLQTDFEGGAGSQIAIVWLDGALALRPVAMHTTEGRAKKLWPINAALRLMGVVAAYTNPDDDEFTAFGLTRYRSNDEVLARAIPVAL